MGQTRGESPQAGLNTIHFGQAFWYHSLVSSMLWAHTVHDSNIPLVRNRRTILYRDCCRVCARDARAFFRPPRVARYHISLRLACRHPSTFCQLCK